RVARALPELPQISAAFGLHLFSMLGIPVSTSQAIVGAIIGWNLFAGARTDFDTISKITMTWVLCPVLSAITAVLLYKATSRVLLWGKPHLLTLDAITRLALILAGAFGAYSLGANNIANVMGVFVPSTPFMDLQIGGFTLTGVQQLFLLGAVAIAVGIFTYSKRVMMTVGSSLMPLTPVAAWVVVMSHSIVLFLFASEGLEFFLANNGLPTVPLVPVSSSQAVVGAVIGIGLLKGGAQLDWKVAGRIASGWITTPIIAALVSVLSLFVLQNVFMQLVSEPIKYQVGEAVIEQLRSEQAPAKGLQVLHEEVFDSAADLSRAIEKTGLDSRASERVLDLARLEPLTVDMSRLSVEHRDQLGASQLAALEQLNSNSYQHVWQLKQALAALSPDWQEMEEMVINKRHNRKIREQISLLSEVFRSE
ncbi:MAG: inorganic phosphate transporter, partial [Pseudomonadota bacterium]